jgi:hypothetical protein
LLAALAAAVGLALTNQPFDQTVVVSEAHATAATAHTAAGCGETWIRGVTENRTPVSMRVASIGHNLSNNWCREPDDVVRAHASDQWIGGDESGHPTHLHIVYLLANNDKILFQAHTAKDRPAEAGCAFVEVVRTPREYECQAEVVANGSGIAFVRFSVLAVHR